MEKKDFPPESTKLTPEIKNLFEFLKENPEPSLEFMKEWGKKILGPLTDLMKKGEIPLDEYKQIILETIYYFKSTSETDGLTGLTSRAGLNKYLLKEIYLAEREKYPISLIFLDMNKLKEINDLDQSHKSGDDAIILTAEALKKSVRKSDIVGRYAGDEFCVILPKASKEGAIRVAKKITKRIDETPLIKGKKLSVSIGIRQWQNESPQEFLNKADKAAYKAKEMKKEFVVSEE